MLRGTYVLFHKTWTKCIYKNCILHVFKNHRCSARWEASEVSLNNHWFRYNMALYIRKIILTVAYLINDVLMFVMGNVACEYYFNKSRRAWLKETNKFDIDIMCLEFQSILFLFQAKLMDGCRSCLVDQRCVLLSSNRSHCVKGMLHMELRCLKIIFNH